MARKLFELATRLLSIILLVKVGAIVKRKSRKRVLFARSVVSIILQSPTSAVEL
jgi:hypothetical protein